MKKIIITFVQAFYTKKNRDAMRFFCLTKKNFLWDAMPTQPLYYTLFRAVLSEEGSEERAIGAFWPVRICVYTSVIQKCITAEKCKLFTSVSHKCEREGTSFVRASTDRKRSVYLQLRDGSFKVVCAALTLYIPRRLRIWLIQCKKCPKPSLNQNSSVYAIY